MQRIPRLSNFSSFQWLKGVGTCTVFNFWNVEHTEPQSLASLSFANVLINHGVAKPMAMASATREVWLETLYVKQQISKLHREHPYTRRSIEGPRDAGSVFDTIRFASSQQLIFFPPSAPARQGANLEISWYKRSRWSLTTVLNTAVLKIVRLVSGNGKSTREKLQPKPFAPRP